MHDTLGGRLSGIAQYADDSARLDPPAALRRRGARRTRLRQGAALLGVTAVTAAGVTLGLTRTSTTTPGDHQAVTASPASAQLTAYQSAVLSKAGVSRATVAALAGSGLTPAQIQALARQITALMSRPGLTTPQIRALEEQRLAVLSKSGPTPAEGQALARQKAEVLRSAQVTRAEQAALARQRMTLAQMAALQRAHLSAAQMAAIQRQQRALAVSAR